MGASVQPVQADPGDRITRTIAAMRAQHATEHDIETYLTQHEGLAPQEDTGITPRNIGRSLMQGATFKFSDEMGLTNRGSQQAFEKQHPWVNALAEIAGGAAAPIAAATALPALASGGGALGLMAGVGALTGAGAADGKPDTPIMTPMGFFNVPDRVMGAAQGGAVSALLGAAGQGIAKTVRPVKDALSTAILDRLHPERVVGRAAKSLLDDPASIATRMAEANAIAPGSASPVTTAVARDGTDQSRFLPMVRAIAADPAAAASAEAKIVGQREAIKAGKKMLGAQMDALEEGKDIVLTPKVRSAMSDVRSVLGGKAPDVPAASAIDNNALGLEKSVPFELDPQKTTMSLADAREALSRLRDLSRAAARPGIELQHGVTQHDINVAKRGLQEVVYDARPDFATVDRKYATLLDHESQTEDALSHIQRARANHAATTAFGLDPMSPGAAITGPKRFALSTLLNNLHTDKAAIADATNRMVVTPGASIKSLLAAAPKPIPHRPMSARQAGLLAASLPPMLRGLLSP